MISGRDTGQPDVAGGPARHIPVLARDAITFLDVRDNGLYIDGTFGAGGYSRALLLAADCRVIAIDRDATAIARLSARADSRGAEVRRRRTCSH